MRSLFAQRNRSTDHQLSGAVWGLLVLASSLLVIGLALNGQPGTGIVAAGVLSGLFLLAQAWGPARRTPPDEATGLLTRTGLLRRLDQTVGHRTDGKPDAAVFVVELNEFNIAVERYSRAGVEQVYRTIGERLSKVVRDSDLVARLDGPVFAVALPRGRRLDLETAIQLCNRMQQTVSRPIEMGPTNLYLTASVGFCIADRLKDATAESLLQAAISATIEAQRTGPGAIRGYSEAMAGRIASRAALSSQVARALEKGELKAFFQPQVATADRRLTGFEALARWIHPTRGMIPPIEFLPALREAGLMEQLGLHMVHEAATALRRWDQAGLIVPRVAVNFATEELRNPNLADNIAMELDRFGLSPDRLTVEVLETVVAGRAEDQVVRTLAALSDLGCNLDLDDFGTGHASITNIRRFSIRRIKIDRSFVARIDEAADQQMMFSAILTMAERLGLGTLAEGVETQGELAMLVELGCEHAQGYGIARPMALEDTEAWIAGHGNGVIKELKRRTA